MFSFSPHAEQDIDGQLIQAFIRQLLSGKLRAVEDARLYALCFGSAITPERRSKIRRCITNLGKQRLNLTVLIELTRLIFKDQVVSHAAGGEFPHAGFVFTPIRMRIEMSRPFIARVFQQLDKKEYILN